MNKVYAYWNRKDNDCTKIFHFLSKNDKHSIIEEFNKESALEIQPIYSYYSNDSKIAEKIKSNDVVIFLTHGTEDTILKFRNNPERDIMEYILIDSNNAELLKDKIVLAFCCSSAKCLGRYCVSEKVGCKAFIGFENDIVYDNGKAEKSRHLIYESYKIAFKKSLLYALRKKCTVMEFQIKLQQFMRKESMRVIFESKNNSLNTMYSGTISSVIALGNLDTVMFT